jgi:hypothetical protein
VDGRDNQQGAPADTRDPGPHELIVPPGSPGWLADLIGRAQLAVNNQYQLFGSGTSRTIDPVEFTSPEVASDGVPQHYTNAAAQVADSFAGLDETDRKILQLGAQAGVISVHSRKWINSTIDTLNDQLGAFTAVPLSDQDQVQVLSSVQSALDTVSQTVSNAVDANEKLQHDAALIAQSQGVPAN